MTDLPEDWKPQRQRLFKSHLLKYDLENNRQDISEKDFEIIGNGSRGNSKKKKVAEALLIWEIKLSRAHCNYLFNSFSDAS